MNANLTAARRYRRGTRQRVVALGLHYAGRLILYVLVAAGAAAVAAPFVWMVSASLKTTEQVFAYPPVWVPNPVVWSNYKEALMTPLHPFIPRFFANTVYVSMASVLGEVLSCALAGFGFARLRFPGRQVLFMVVLGTMAIPFYVVMIPQFILFRWLNWLNTFKPLIVPCFFATNGFFIFLFRQFFSRISQDLFDAARIDGNSTWGVFLRIVLPLSKPVIATTCIFGFTGHWNDFLAPLLYLSRSNLRTVSVALAYFKQFGNVQWPYLMAASTVAMLPCILMFFFFQRVFIQGVVITGVKG